MDERIAEMGVGAAPQEASRRAVSKYIADYRTRPYVTFTPDEMGRYVQAIPLARILRTRAMLARLRDEDLQAFYPMSARLVATAWGIPGDWQTDRTIPPRATADALLDACYTVVGNAHRDLAGALIGLDPLVVADGIRFLAEMEDRASWDTPLPKAVWRGVLNSASGENEWRTEHRPEEVLLLARDAGLL